ncbi:phosphatase PAP2 family protein [Enterococcus avium]|uniref:phosphatase PAP2 family protein n=1 Tax=Enterococcus avium TaxID=33945 RepID=UPI00232E252A|nr:phosphatase PAP2 family protein [Enterococcus avium]MDB1727433.1 phosphatase PAP2 family protein [Enterococcus avium]MDB1731825.1 phosphatase PAP2 family protein [Enterococcus avium]
MLIGGIICLLVFVVLLIALSLSGLQRFDELVTLKVIALRRPFITKIMLFFTKLGRATGVIIIIGALALVPPFRSAILKPAGLSLALSWGLAYIIKRLIKRPRPVGQRLVEEVDASFPSFHATCSSALYCGIALGGGEVYPQFLPLLVIICLVIAGMIGFSRVYLGIHYLSDVVGGWLFGAGITLILQWGLLVYS